jgi:hypothetical protein
MASIQDRLNKLQEMSRQQVRDREQETNPRTKATKKSAPVSQKLQPTIQPLKTTDPRQDHITDIVDSTTGTVIQVDRPSRLGSMAKGAVQGTGANYASSGGSLLDLMRSVDTANSFSTKRANQEAENAAHYREMLKRGTLDDGTPITASMRKQLETLAARAEQRSGVYRQGAEAQHAPISRAINSAYETADRLSEQSAENIAAAKEGLGGLGQFAVDVGVAGTQLAGDALIGALLAPVTGGASALAPMAVRGFGSGTQQARQEGATLGQQLAYGAGSAALSVATEQISNIGLFRRAFGAGVADNLAEKLVSRFGENTAIQTMNRLAQTPVGRIAASMLGEGSEEFIEDVFQPVLQRAIYDPDARFDMSEALYDFAVGAVLGGVGGGVDITRRRATDAAGTAQTETAPVSTTQAQEAAEGTTGFLEPTLVSRVRQSIPHIQNMDPVAEVTGTEIPRSGKLVDRLASFVNAIGNKVNRPGFGDVLFSRGRIKSSMIGHGTGPSKIETFAAVPDVIRNGQQIDYQQNWKGRGYDTYTFAAPITYRGQPTYLGVIVTKDSASNRYYLHEVVDANGDVIFRNDESPASTPDGTSTLAGGLDTVVDTGDGAGTTPGTVDTVTDGRASQGVPASDSTIAPGAENVNSDILAQILFGDIRQETGDTQAPPTYDNLGSARRGFTTPGMEGQERTSRLAESMPYNQYQEAATGLSREDYAKIFRYESQTEGRSLNLAEELVYAVRDGQRTFLRDIDETAFHELVQSLDDATAWNAPQTDAARMIQQELQGRSANLEIPSEEYTDFLRIMREHETATGQGVQANAKWSRRDNQNGQSSELEAWDNLQNSNLSEEEKRSTFQQIVKWDTEIEQATEPQQLKDIILNVAQQRGVLNGLTGRQSRIMTAVANSSLDSLTFDQLKQFAYASTSALSTDSTPANMGQKIKTIQILNMLSNPKTAVKNITGNTSFYGLDALSMKGAALLDMALSKVTGTRSVAYERSNLGQAAKAMQMAIAEITMDVDMGGNQSRYGTSSRRTFKASGNFVDRVMSMLERNQAYLLNATDEFYKGLARSNASRTQALVDQGKIKTTDKDYAQNQADALARYRTFQDDSKLSLAIQQVHDVLNMVAGIGDSGRSIRGRTVHAFGAGDIVAPFTRVAGNLASRGLEYSPANAVKGIVEMGKTVAQAVSGQNVDPAAQARAVSDTTRGLTGTAIAYGFMLLAQSGLLSQAGDEDDPDVAALNSSEGITGTQLNISATERALSGGSTEWQSGDTLIDLSSIEPLNLLMNLGTEMAKSEGNPIVSSFNAVPKSFMDATAELPVMQFIGNAATDIIKYGQDPQEVLLQEGANTVASSLIPNILRSTARGLDDRPRNTYSGDTLGEQVVDSVKNSIPGLRETLPGSVNPLGEEKLYQGSTADRLLNALLNPVGVNTYDQSEVSQNMEALRERTGETSFYPSKSAPSELSYTKDGNTYSKSLTYEERQDYLRDRGAVALTTLSSMMGSSAYKRANDTTKTELLDLCNDYASQRAKKTILGADSVPAWVNNAETAQNDLGISPAEYLALYHQYGAEIMSGTAYEKTKQAVAAGLTVEQYADMKNGIDADKNGYKSKSEARAYLDSHNFTQEQKADLWTIINKSWEKNNPYA